MSTWESGCSSANCTEIRPEFTCSGRATHAYRTLTEFPHLKKQFWGRHLWARGYFCCSSGNVTDEVIAKYIAEQNVDQDEDFKVDG